MRVLKKIKEYTFNSDERYFVFTDGSRRTNNNKIVVGLGADIRDGNGRKVLFYSEEFLEKDIPSFANKDQFEELAVLNTLSICYEQGIRNIFLQSDSKSMVTKINNYLEIKNSGKSFTKDVPEIFIKIHRMIENFSEIFFEYIPREENMSADFYSKSTKNLKSQRKKVNIEQMPSQSVSEMVSEIERELFIKSRTLSINFHKSNNKPLLTQKEINRYLDKTMKIKLEDNQQDNCFDISFSVENNGVDEQKYKKIKAPYNRSNKVVILSYLLINLITEKSSYPLLQTGGSKEFLNFVYDDKLWIQFDSFEHNQRKMSKKTLVVSNGVFKEINKIVAHDFSKVMSGQSLKNMEKVLFNKTKFHCLYHLF